MPKSYLSVEQFLKLAIEFEVDSAVYYRTMQKGVSDREVLDLLRNLEQQELDHERALREYGSGRRGKDVLQFAPDMSLSMPPAPKKLEFAGLLEVAIERERQSVRIYQATADLAGGQLRVILEELAGFERQHENRLVALKGSRRSFGPDPSR